MHFERRSHFSHFLQEERAFNVYGHAGKPIIVFPSSGGSQNEYGDFGMIAACQSFIDQGLVTFYTPDSYDRESWFATWKSPEEMGRSHDRYDQYIIQELVPLIKHERNWQDGMMATGCSMGAYHTINFALRHPDVFDQSIALSGAYDARFFTGDYQDSPSVYYNSPIDYLEKMHDPWFIDRYRKNLFIVCVGQGNWEAPHIDETQRLEALFQRKQLPGWFDYWGFDVPHDWDWWRIQMPYYLDQLVAQGRL
ncbi:MAG: esterase family protein [Enterococcus sp.]|jgi:esterase/lipase superfamily enzyme|nr:esterase family protein [Enterococcus sp.]HRM24423.1 alpha/beta hydrolase-fold protein [Enterococcus aquimarinus]MBP7086109.1 esterase family protein [Enterococcus sp.]MBP7953083.1 esterase family protein [Enterococcus sp.]MBP8693656.1 esterase family protein [Enterococcus sp.]